eukprot:scaffold8935_cov199-Ochromonas_danica.AAC.2
MKLLFVVLPAATSAIKCVIIVDITIVILYLAMKYATTTTTNLFFPHTNPGILCVRRGRTV